MSEHEDGFYYCLKHHRVEDREGCANKDRIGPFPTPEAAAHALETVAKREAAYDTEEAEDDGTAGWA